MLLIITISVSIIVGFLLGGALATSKIDGMIDTEMERDFYRAQLENLFRIAEVQPEMTAQVLVSHVDGDVQSLVAGESERREARFDAPHLTRA